MRYIGFWFARGSAGRSRARSERQIETHWGGRRLRNAVPCAFDGRPPIWLALGWRSGRAGNASARHEAMTRVEVTAAGAEAGGERSDGDGEPASLREALAESLAVVGEQLSSLSRQEQRELLSTFDAGKAASWERRKLAYERLLRGLTGEGPDAEGDEGVGRELVERLAAQVRSFSYASRCLRVPSGVLCRTKQTGPDDLEASSSGASVDATFSPQGGRGFVAARKSRLRKLVLDRCEELETFVSGGGEGLAGTQDQPGKSHQVKALSTPLEDHHGALYALKALKLLDLQRKVRADVLLEKSLTDGEGLGGGASKAVGLFNHSRLCRARQDIGSLSNEERNGQILSANLAAVEAAQLQASRQQRAEERAQLHAQHQARIAEQQRIAAEQRRKRQEIYERARAEHQAKLRVLQTRRQFLQEAAAVRENLKAGNKALRKQRKQRSEQTMSFHSKERKKKIREANARVLALRTDNIEEYIKMAKEAKNSRISMLLENTEGLLLDLGIKVADQRAATMGQYEDNDELLQDFNQQQLEQKEEDGVEENLISGQKRYLNLVHSKKEVVDEQPFTLEGGNLREYQLGGLQWMVSLYINGLNGILADEMGLGKTIQSISLFAYLMEKKGNYGPHLVLCPKAVLSNWMVEFGRWLPNVNVILYDGKPEERRALREDRMAAQTFNVLLTHYDMIMRDKKFLTKYQWEYIIIDEGHRLKNKDSKLSEILRGVYQSRNRLLLTGTPIQNNLKELWSLLNFVLPKVFDTSDSFDDWFSAPFKGSQEDIALSEEEELLIIHRLHQVIRPFLLRRKKAEVEKELPDKSLVICKCDLSAWQRVYYKQITEGGSVMLETPKGNAKSRTLMNSAMQLRKACIHPYLFLDSMYPPYEPEDPEELIRASGKFDLLDRILPKLKAAGHRVLLFSQMTRAMDLLELYFEMRGYNYLRLDGETKTNERPLLLAEFNAPNSEVFLFMLSTRAGGLGLNLQTADTVILFDSDWNPQMDKQAEDRAHRIGQKREVKIITLVTVGSIEEVIIERARQKADIDNKVIQAGMFNQSSSHKERHETLSNIFKRGIQDIGKGVSTDDQINNLIARGDDEVELFAKMDLERQQVGLLGDTEVPQWALKPPEEEKKEEKEELGPRRAKARKVVYDDGLTDLMWSKLIDEGEDVQEAIEKRQERKRGRLRK